MVTAARVPVFKGHCASIVCQLGREVTHGEVMTVLSQSDGLTVLEHSPSQPPLTPRLTNGRQESFVSRVRLGLTDEQHQKSRWLQMWNVADNLKKGAATNATQILGLFLQASHDN